MDLKLRKGNESMRPKIYRGLSKRACEEIGGEHKVIGGEELCFVYGESRGDAAIFRKPEVEVIELIEDRKQSSVE